jgi:hypothetical protein
MRTLAEGEVIAAILEEFTHPRDPIHLYVVYGQAMFPMWTSSGSLRNAVALYLIRRGTSDRAPINENFTMPADNGLVELAEGWAIANITLRSDFSVGELRASLKKAERALLGKE